VKAASSLALYLLYGFATLETFMDREKQMEAFLKQAGLSDRSCPAGTTTIRTDWTKGPADVECYRVVPDQAATTTGQTLGTARLEGTPWEAVLTANSNLEIPMKGPSRMSLVIHFRQAQTAATRIGSTKLSVTIEEGATKAK
jgi:hypothetical protein